MNWLISFFVDRTFGSPRSSEWSKFRNKHIKDKCEVCGAKFFLEAHHIKPFYLYPELELEETNLVTLCRKHHLEWAHFFSWSRYNPEIKEWITKVNKSK